MATPYKGCVRFIHASAACAEYRLGHLHYGLGAAEPFTAAHDDVVVFAGNCPVLARIARFNHVSIVHSCLYQHGKCSFQCLAQSIRHHVVAIKAQLQAPIARTMQYRAPSSPLRNVLLREDGAFGQRWCVKAHR